MGTKLLLGFGGTVNQAVVHRRCGRLSANLCFGDTVNQVVVYQARPFHRRARVSEVP